MRKLRELSRESKKILAIFEDSDKAFKIRNIVEILYPGTRDDDFYEVYQQTGRLVSKMLEHGKIKKISRGIFCAASTSSDKIDDSHLKNIKSKRQKVKEICLELKDNIKSTKVLAILMPTLKRKTPQWNRARTQLVPIFTFFQKIKFLEKTSYGTYKLSTTNQGASDEKCT